MSRRLCKLLGFVAILAGTLVPQSGFCWQPPFNGLDLPGLSGPGEGDPVSITAEYKIYRGTREGLLSVTATIAPGWHVYSTTQRAGGPTASKLQVTGPAGFELSRPFVADREPHIKPPDIFPVPSEEFTAAVVWTAPFRVADSVDLPTLKVTVVYDGLVCQESGSCLPLSNVTAVAKDSGELDPPARGEFVNPRIHATLRGEIRPRTVVPGGKVTLALAVEPASQYHVYALAERDPAKVSKPTLIAWKERNGWATSAPRPSHPPVKYPGPPSDELAQDYHEEPVTWTIELSVPNDATPAGYELRGLIGYQTCKNSSCDRPSAAEFSATVSVVKEGEAIDEAEEPLTFKLSTYDVVAKLAAEAAGTATAVAETPTPAPVQPTREPAVPPLAGAYAGPLLEIPKLRPIGGADEQESMLIVLPTAFLAGFILNFMPCVLPVIGLKIVSFVQQAGHGRSRIFFLNVWYTAGILAVFLILATLAVFAGFSWGKQFQSSTFNIVLAGVVFAFALSFLGVWEIPLPGFVGSSGATKAASQEGPTGAFFKGILTTVLATPCTGPLLVPALAWALKQPPVVTYAAFICVGLGMAFPYLVVGAFPKLISFLPKPGDWMETFKQLMGFVLIGTVVYLLTFVRAPLVVPTVAFLMGLWAALWWVGRVPNWEEWHKRVRVWAVGTAFATAIGLFAFSWLDEVMESRFRRDVTAAANDSRFNPERLAPQARNASESQELPWKPYSLELLSQLLLVDKKVVFVDFTADWCPNCKVNEKFVLNVATTRSYFEKNGIETIKADMTFDSPPIERLLQQLAGTAAIPVYAVFRPDEPYEPIVMEGILSQSGLLEKLAQASGQSSSGAVAALSGEESRVE